MTERVCRLRERSLAAHPTVSAERARIVTGCYREHADRVPIPILRALCLQEICRRQPVFLDPDELIVGERGPAPKVTPTYPEVTCHSLEDLRILSTREKTNYQVPADVLSVYETLIIPYWSGRSLRDVIFAELPEEWHAAYQAGIFTEFMEQRAPGHTVADGKIYRQGLRGLKRAIAAARASGSGETQDPRRAQWQAMEIAADAIIQFARRHAVQARRLAAEISAPEQRAELLEVASMCERIPEHPPGTFQEALQAYWFCHLGVITELNGWDAFSPGHLDQHLAPFYRRGQADGTLTRERARELLSCFFIKFNDHPAPPKVGVTAAESGTYTDFANISLGGLLADGDNGANEVSDLLLEVIEELHLLQPSTNVQISSETPDAFLEAACRVIRRGYGFPSVFNADAVVAELTRQGKSLVDARAGGTSGCVEAGAFGKEAYILTGYFNLPKLLELALHDGRDPRSGSQLGPQTGDPRRFRSFAELFGAWERQLGHFVEIKIRGNARIEQRYAGQMPAPFLSLLIDDCAARGRDYNAGGARYNTSYIQGVGIGTLTDSLAAVRELVYRQRSVPMEMLLEGLETDFRGAPAGGQWEHLRLRLRNRAPKWGNDDDAADQLMQEAFEAFFRAVDRRPNERGGEYHINMLPTTCHVHFGAMTGATPDGRRAGRPFSEGISPVQGMDRRGPTAVLRSAAKMDHLRTGGTLLNMRFAPELLAGEDGIARLAQLIRTYFRLGGHHIQFNVFSAETLREAQADAEAHCGLIVRVAGYSDYFCDLSRVLQDEIISRTAQARF